MNIYIYIYLIFDIIFLSSPLPLDSTKKIRMERSEKRGGRESGKGTKWKHEREREMRQREEYTYIYIEGVVVLLVDFPFSYSI